MIAIKNIPLKTKNEKLAYGCYKYEKTHYLHFYIHCTD